MRSPCTINLYSTTLSLDPDRCSNNRQPTSQKNNSSTLALNSNQLETKLNKFNKLNTDSQLKHVQLDSISCENNTRLKRTCLILPREVVVAASSRGSNWPRRNETPLPRAGGYTCLLLSYGGSLANRVVG